MALRISPQKIFEIKASGFDKPAYDNVLALIEIRNNSAHFINKDLYLGRRVLEIGTASLQNYLSLIGEWFQIDLSRYNFFLMPLSFYHGFEAITTASVSKPSDQIARLLAYLDSLESQSTGDSEKHVALRLETKLVRTKDTAPVAFRWTNDPNAPAVTLTEEDVFRNYPWTYRELAGQLKKRYSNFMENQHFHRIRKKLEEEKKYSIIRCLNPTNPRSAKQRFFNPNIVHEFDKHYTRSKKG